MRRVSVVLALLLSANACGSDDASEAKTGAGGSGGHTGGSGGHTGGKAGTGGTGGTGGITTTGGTGGAAGSGGTSSTKHTGPVTLDGHSLSDDQGRFQALGATLMWAAWGMKNDTARLEQQLDFLSKHGFHYFRALGVVGDYQNADFWDGREIDWHWPDYDQVIAGLTDLAYDKYGLRVQWTLIGDGQLTVPSMTDRYALADRFIAMSKGREQKILLFETANESWKNGFDGPTGVDDLRALTQYLNDRTSILVAASSPNPVDCGGADAVYTGGVADIATLHFDRDISQVDGHWRPVWQPWWVHDCNPALPIASNNEPIGPGASVSSENDPLTLASSAVSTYISGLPFHVFHSKAGVRGDDDIWTMSGADAFQHLAQFLPPDLSSWTLQDPKDASAPLRVYAEDASGSHADTYWPELGAGTSGVVRAYGAVNGPSFIVMAIGILDHVVIEARQPLSFDVIDPLSGAVVSSESLTSGQQTTLSGAEARVIRGELE